MTKDEWYTQLFERLSNSKFRSSFHLKQKDTDYINEKGMDTIREHARDFIAKREAPAVIPNDGKQTVGMNLTDFSAHLGIPVEPWMIGKRARENRRIISLNSYHIGLSMRR